MTLKQRAIKEKEKYNEKNFDFNYRGSNRRFRRVFGFCCTAGSTDEWYEYEKEYRQKYEEKRRKREEKNERYGIEVNYEPFAHDTKHQ